MADSDLEEENKRLKGLVENMLGDQHKRMMRAKKNRGRITLDLSTDMPLPKSLGGGVEIPIKEHRVNIDEVASEWAKETAKANQQTLDTSAALTKHIIDGGSSVQPTNKLPNITDFLPTFIKEKSRGWNETAKRHNEHAIDLFIKILGDMNLSDYDRHDIGNYIETIEQVHKSYGKSHKDKDRNIAEILAIASDKQKMTITTLDKHLRSVKSVFKTSNQYHDTVINLDQLFGGQQFSKKVRQPDTRERWTVDELNKLFLTPQWTGTASEKCSVRYNAGNKIIKDAYWWLPIIGIYTGMRLEEICQLQCGDLKSKDGVQYLDVVEGEDQRLKTTSSIRHVPIHSELTNLGFLDLFDAKTPTHRIFAELTRGGADEKLGYEYSSDFTKYRKKTDTYKEQKDFHSFRHTFVSTLWEQTRDMLLVGSIVGHKNASQTAIYTHIDLQTKADALAKLKYDGLDLAHLI